MRQLPVKGVLLLIWPAWAQQPPALNTPVYSQNSIVHAATNRPGKLAPNTIATVYGKGLATMTAAAGPKEVATGFLPSTYLGSCTSVFVDNFAAPLLFVSPEQVNFVVPANLRPGIKLLKIFCDSNAGPKVEVELVDAVPGLFQSDASTIIATHANGELCTRLKPPVGGEILILYAAGLGQTLPSAITGFLATRAAGIEKQSDFQVLLNRQSLPKDAILYAGIAPGFAGLYQINVRLPASIEIPLEIQLRIGEEFSPAGLFVPGQ